MKTILLMLLTAVLPLGAKEAFKFPIEDKVVIEEATYFLNGDQHGGSVSVVLRDGKGTLSFVHYLTKDAGVKFGGGLLSFGTNKAEKGTTFARGSDDEAQLLKLLRLACMSSFGSADPAILREPTGKKDGFNRMAMAALLRHFPTKAESGPGE